MPPPCSSSQSVNSATCFTTRERGEPVSRGPRDAVEGGRSAQIVRPNDLPSTPPSRPSRHVRSKPTCIPTDGRSIAPRNLAQRARLVVTSPRPRVLQLFKCATCWIQQTPCSGAPIRTACNGLGRLGEWSNRPELVTDPRDVRSVAQTRAEETHPIRARRPQSSVFAFVVIVAVLVGVVIVATGGSRGRSAGGSRRRETEFVQSHVDHARSPIVAVSG